LTVTKRSAKNFHHNGRLAETTKLSSLKGTDPGGQEEKHQPQHSQQAYNEDDQTPSFQVGRIQFIGYKYNFYILQVT